MSLEHHRVVLAAGSRWDRALGAARRPRDRFAKSGRSGRV
ncbi:hypothetical protein SAVIM338S_00965 [Streptomyces avidinii]